MTNMEDTLELNAISLMNGLKAQPLGRLLKAKACLL